MPHADRTAQDPTLIGAAERISVTDEAGDQRQGFIVRLAAWDREAAAALQNMGGDFHIVILEEPPPVREAIPRATVVCAPEQPLAAPTMIREAAPTYRTRGRQSAGSIAATLTAGEMKLLARGSVLAPIELQITPREAFGGSRPRFDLLASELLTREALADAFGALATALHAPASPRTSQPRELAASLRELLAVAQGTASRIDEELPGEAAEALQRMSQLCAAAFGSFLAAERHLYSGSAAMAEDVYLLRALAHRPEEALEVLAMRSFAGAARAPTDDNDLALDRAIALEQLQFAGLVPEPQRLSTARNAFQHFRGGYLKRYKTHHRAYCEEMGKLRALLLAARAQVEALRKLNSLTELGPPVGGAAIAAYEQLLEETAGCPPAQDATGELDSSAVCPACALQLDQQPPRELVADALDRIAKAIQRQMTLLSGVAVRQVLERSGDARVERFLKVVQAAQLASLVEILDDELVGYLRRFLVEARIGAVLEPVLTRLQEGTAPDEDEARETMREMARVLQRAFRLSQRALPEGGARLKQGETKRAKR